MLGNWRSREAKQSADCCAVAVGIPTRKNRIRDRCAELVLEGRDGHAHDRRSDVRRAGIGVAQRHAVDEAV